ncbi:hypothetical protein K438DRAFT_1841690 [Mycena galopus ATCC 62051]|nr:hypothetical protein K438DRAFT_1841690 [Mycena galopus ATCC 62051]
MSALPPVPKRRRNEPDAPGLSTRSANKYVRPAEAAGLTNTRRSSEQKAADDAKEAQEKAQVDEEESEKLARVAAIEDKQREDDLQYGQNPHHPVDPPRRKTPKNASPGPARRSLSTTPAREDLAGDEQEELGGEEFEEMNQDPDADKNEFEPSDSENDTEDIEDDNDSDSAAQKPKKKLKKGRVDIQAARQTQDSTGTPEIESSGQKRKAKDHGKGKAPAKKLKTAKKGGLTAGVKSTLKNKRPKDGDDVDGIVQYGGPALDDDAGEIVEREKGTGKGKPKQSVVRIEASAKRITQKEQRGDGSKRWKLSHIPGPANNGGIFTNNVWPNIRQLLGRANPWDTATNKQVQDQLDRSYGKDEMDAEANVFQGLISYRTQSWRGGFPTQAHKCILGMVVNSKEREAAGTATEDDYKLHTPEGMQAYIESMLEVDNKTRTKAFQWREWDDDKGKHAGLFQSSLVLFTYSYHITLLEGRHEPEEAALGALILASQAMERELGLWKTGEYVAPGKSQNEQFSFDQWGDCDEKATATTPKRRNLRATRFVPSIKKWTDDQWEQVNTAAAKYLDKKRKSRSVSVASSDVESVVEQEPEVIIEFS